MRFNLTRLPTCLLVYTSIRSQDDESIDTSDSKTLLETLFFFVNIRFIHVFSYEGFLQLNQL